jgi:hypothetical protein
MKNLEITIDIKKKHVYFLSFVLIILLIIGVKAFDSKQPWHPIDQIVNSYGDPISYGGELTQYLGEFSVLNSIYAKDYSQYSNNTLGIGNITQRYKLFWEGTFNTTNPSDPENNIRLCYYSYISRPPGEYSCRTITKTCAPQSATINYYSTTSNCNPYICSKICPKAIACYGNLVPEYNELGCDVSNTIVNYNSGVCSSPSCKYDTNSGDYYCGCNCNLNSPTNYNQVYEEHYNKDNKRCLIFSKNT